MSRVTAQDRIPAAVFNRLCAIQRRLHKWAEDECNGAIQWDDEECTIPRRYYPNCYGSFTSKGGIIPNQEAKLLKEATELAAKCGGLIYHQADPRGCALYFYRESDLAGRKFPIDQCYSSVALACCK
jgi:hypothetical protein